jgi:phosphatidylserine/phosphatidylglycerophosphate/cardiolipin synthase-like enzyme
MNRIFLATLLALAVSGATAKKTGNEFTERIAECAHALTDKAPTSPFIETAFSPETGAERLVVKIINSSERSIRLAAYSFTSPVVVRALLNAKKRGCDVQAVIDARGNRSKASIAAMNLLVNAGIPVPASTSKKKAALLKIGISRCLTSSTIQSLFSNCRIARPSS